MKIDFLKMFFSHFISKVLYSQNKNMKYDFKIFLNNKTTINTHVHVNID